MRIVETFGVVEGGKLLIDKREEFIAAIRTFDDQKVRVKVEKLYKKRSNDQNSYYWGVLIPLFAQGWKDTTGETIDSEQAHEILKQECNYTELVNSTTGEILKYGKTTTKLTTVEFEDYQERCRRFIFDWFGIVAPLPNEDLEKALDV